MKLVFYMDLTGQLRPLDVTRMTKKRVYFRFNGRERSCSLAELQRPFGAAPCKHVPNNGIYTGAAAKQMDESRRAVWELRERGRIAFEADSGLVALGLSAGASRDDVKRAFRERVKTAHPDGGGSDAAFIELKRNYESALRAAR
ncbi:MAG TPA: hypothetical protein VHC69_31650 [Polyangiaceae bacterium]|nr:hypothetical protein [Polyangiaceae bacterium]